MAITRPRTVGERVYRHRPSHLDPPVGRSVLEEEPVSQAAVVGTTLTLRREVQ